MSRRFQLDDFERTRRNVTRLAVGVFVVNALLACAVVGGLGWVAYRLVTHFTGSP